MRSTFSTTIRFGPVSIPAKAYSTHTSSADIKLNQLHEPCGGRIKYVKTCTNCGEVPAKEIVKGNEFSPGQFAIVDPKEVKQDDKHCDVISFVNPSSVDRRYFGKSYYLSPEGDAKTYHLLRAALVRTKKAGLAKCVISGREQLVLVLPLDGALVVQVLAYAAEVRPVSEVDLGEKSHTASELKLTCDLIKATSHPVEIRDYTNPHNERLQALIDAKVEGKEIIHQEDTEEEVQVINLVDALKKSLKQKAG